MNMKRYNVKGLNRYNGEKWLRGVAGLAALLLAGQADCLAQTKHLGGTVRDASGAPAAGVLVSFHPGQFPGASPYMETRTDARGGYEFLIEPQASNGVWMGSINPVNFVLARDVERNLAAIQEFESMPTNIDLELQPGITLVGVVNDNAGAPISSAMVNLRMLAGHSLPSLTEKPAGVNGQGLFSFPALPQGREYMLDRVTAPGFGSAYDRVEAKDTQTNRYDFPILALKRADQVLAGQVLGPDGQPLAGASVRFNGEGQREWPVAKTDDAGHFVFDEVCEGEVHVSANWNGAPGSGIFLTDGGGLGARARAGDTNIVIKLRDPNVFGNNFSRQTVNGTVVDSSGAPASGVRITVAHSGLRNQSAWTDASGNYKIQWVPFPVLGPTAPKIKSSVVARDFARNLAATGQFDESSGPVDLRLLDGLTLTGSVQGPDGEPVTNARVGLVMTLRKAGESLEDAVTDAQGAFEFKTLPQEQDATYYVRVSASGLGSVPHARAQIDPAHAGTLVVPPVKLKSANLPVAGVVLGPDDKPLPGIWVNLGGAGQPGGNAMTDADGRFVFHNVVAGSVLGSVGMAATDTRPALSGTFKAQSGDTNVVVKVKTR
jgi:Carboxypeptidase regulatory-like domain